jgi:hypothetical protein
LNESVYFPFPLPLHIVGAALCAGFMIFSFIRSPKAYKAVITADILLTFAVYACRGITQRSILSIAEIVIFIIAVVLKHLSVKPRYQAKHYK